MDAERERHRAHRPAQRHSERDGEPRPVGMHNRKPRTASRTRSAGRRSPHFLARGAAPDLWSRRSRLPPGARKRRRVGTHRPARTGPVPTRGAWFERFAPRADSHHDALHRSVQRRARIGSAAGQCVSCREMLVGRDGRRPLASCRRGRGFQPTSLAYFRAVNARRPALSSRLNYAYTLLAEPASEQTGACARILVLTNPGGAVYVYAARMAP